MKVDDGNSVRGSADIRQSHTILGSKSQRGLTQLTLDVLFQNTLPYLADIDSHPSVFNSLSAADVSEAQLLSAGQFLDIVYASDNGPSLSRATTPALVRDSTPPTTTTLPATSPTNFADSINSNAAPPRPSTSVYDRLYPSLAKYQQRPQTPQKQNSFRASATLSPFRSPGKRASRLVHLTRSVAKTLTSRLQQDTSFVSAPSNSKRYMPRVSTLPQYPPVDDIALEVDDSAEYAIVISMYEVYNDRIFDLLTASASSKAPQKRRALLFKSTELSPDRKVVAGLRKVVCSSLEEALLVLETGLQERKVAGTGSNAVSSRSHGFFCMEIKKRHRGRYPGPWSSSSLTIVDLAGSERARAAKTAGSTLAEAGKINESLMYLGQCMQMLSDNANTTTPNLVPFRQCKLTELMFCNSFATHHHSNNHKGQQKFIMVVTADPLGDFNATSQILRYSALAREVTVPRIPSVTSTILSGTAAVSGSTKATTSPASAILQEELDLALATIADLRQQLDTAQLLLADETQRRQEAEASWKASETRIEDMEAELREELASEFESRLLLEQRRWRAARDAELDAQDEHLDRKLDLLAQNLTIYEDETAEEAEKENLAPAIPVGQGSSSPSPLGYDPTVELVGKLGACRVSVMEERYDGLEEENLRLKERLVKMEREAKEREVMKSPSKKSTGGKLRVFKTPSRRWEGSSGISLDDI
jgi:hypothetical protein